MVRLAMDNQWFEVDEAICSDGFKKFTEICMKEKLTDPHQFVLISKSMSGETWILEVETHGLRLEETAFSRLDVRKGQSLYPQGLVARGPKITSPE